MVGGGRGFYRRSNSNSDGNSDGGETNMEGEWEDSPAMRGIGQDRGQDNTGAAAGRGLGVLPPQEHR